MTEELVSATAKENDFNVAKLCSNQKKIVPTLCPGKYLNSFPGGREGKSS